MNIFRIKQNNAASDYNSLPADQDKKCARAKERGRTGFASPSVNDPKYGKHDRDPAPSGSENGRMTPDPAADRGWAAMQGPLRDRRDRYHREHLGHQNDSSGAPSPSNRPRECTPRVTSRMALSLLSSHRTR